MKPAPRAIRAFWLRLVLLLAASWMPFPYLPDAYTRVLGSTTNAFLSAIDAGSRVAVRFEPPERITPRGSWKANLHILDRNSGRSVRMLFDVRSFSYRPIATFVVLAAASTLQGARAHVIVWGGGLPAMVMITSLLSALPLHARFGSALGVGPGLATVTAYQAMATPVMMYAVPALLWFALIHVTRLRSKTATPPTPLSEAEP